MGGWPGGPLGPPLEEQGWGERSQITEQGGWRKEVEK